MNSLYSCAPFCDSLGIIAERTVPAPCRTKTGAENGNRLLSTAAAFLLVVEQALVKEMKKEKTATGSVGHCEGVGLFGSIPKAKPRPKAVGSRKRLKLDAKGVFCFFHSAWEASQRPFAVFSFFISTAAGFHQKTVWAYARTVKR
ncbi:hypothetical protein [Brevibacillus borstelensis]|uniref:hypothetical protein n=1 Tax=Brevibacillus borstelensis TaxID=45462 RepID=UPI0030BA2E1F